MGTFFKMHGPLAFLVIAAGIAALGTGLLSVSLSKSRAGAKVGLLALGLVALTCTLTVGGVMSARMRTDRAAKEIEEPEKTAYVVAGYSATGGLSKLGLILGGAALVAAAIGTLRGLSVKEGATAKSDDKAEQLGEMSDSTLGLGALVVGSLAVFSIVAAFMPLVMKPPGMELAADDPARKFRDAERLLADGRVAEGCAALEDGYANGGDPKRAKLRSIEGLVGECFDQKLDAALAAPDAPTFDKLVADLEATKMPLDESHKKRLADVVEMRKAAPEKP